MTPLACFIAGALALGFVQVAGLAIAWLICRRAYLRILGG